MATNTVETIELAGNSIVSDLSIISLFMQADIIVKFVMLLLFFASLWCWAIIFDKWRYFRKSRGRIEKFEQAYNSSNNIAPLSEKIKETTDNPMALMLLSGFNAAKNTLNSGSSIPSEDLIKIIHDRVLFAIEKVKNKNLEVMEKDLIFLATVGSAAPFIGLFGTVWGIVNSFKAIAATKNTTLAVVAPGIAEALLATAIGLFAAIPAVIFYNIYSNEIRKLSTKLEDFGLDLTAKLISQTINAKKKTSK